MIELLKYIIPSLVVLAATYIVMHKQMSNENDRRNFEMRKQAQNTVTPIRLRGYERLSLLLDRTIPENMLLKMNLPNMTAIQLQTELLSAIRTEFEHNISQQVYVSAEAWLRIKAARESLLGLVNQCATTVQANDSALKLAEIIISAYAHNGETPTEQAQLFLKQEIQQLF